MPAHDSKDTGCLMEQDSPWILTNKSQGSRGLTLELQHPAARVIAHVRLGCAVDGELGGIQRAGGRAGQDERRTGLGLIEQR